MCHENKEDLNFTIYEGYMFSAIICRGVNSLDNSETFKLDSICCSTKSGYQNELSTQIIGFWVLYWLACEC